MAAEDGNFFSRWSRRKAQVRQGLAPPEPARPQPTAATPAPALAPVADLPAAEVSQADVSQFAHATPPAPTMDDVAQLHAGSDFSRFMAPGVDSGVKNAALKKLFADPHYNVMDGLDTYIDDYHRPDPLPSSWLRRMNQSDALGLFDDEQAVADAAVSSSPSIGPDDLAEPATAASHPPTIQTPEPAAHEDPDLRLQPHDAAGPEGAGLGAGPDAGRQH